MKNLIQRTIFLSVFTALLLISSCTKDFDKIDTNPYGFTTASDGSLFNGVIASLQLPWNEQFYINNEILYKQSQLAAETKGAWGNYTIGTDAIWSNYYLALTSVRELEKRFETYPQTPAIINMKAMLKTVLAYKTFKVTDIFGDIPFTNAGYGFQTLEYLHPKYDKQRDIYIAELAELAWAAENINDTAKVVEPLLTFKKFDNLFHGDLNKWRKFANSLRLRYAMRMSEKEPELAGEIIKEIIEKNLPVLVGYNFTNAILESACMWPAATGFSDNGVNWSFREHNGLRMGSNIWHQISVNDAPDGSGIFDPRAYIFFEGDETNSWKPYPQISDASTPSSQGSPYGGFRDDAATYGLKNKTNYSPFNFFIIYDPNNMPIIFMTGAEVHFIKAEAYFRGIGVAVDKSKADIEYMNGINASVDWWLSVAKNLKLPKSGLKFNDKINIPTGIDAASVLMKFGSWNASSEDEKLQFIYTQRWIDAFRQPWEAYAEARRTNLTPREGPQINHFRLPYPPSESQYNTVNWQEAKNRQGGEEPTTKIWWVK